MNDQQCLTVELEVIEWGARLGAPNIGDESIREGERVEGSTRRELSPRERLVYRLESLERRLVLMHRGVYEKSMRSIAKVIDQSSMDGVQSSIPAAAFVQTTQAGEPAPSKFSLSDLPDLTEQLAQLRTLITLVREDDDRYTE